MDEEGRRALFRLGRELRYRPLPIIGRSVWIASVATIEPTLRQLVAPWIPASAPWDGCRIDAGLAKYGLLDRWFEAPPALLDDPSTLVGVAALRENRLGEREPEADPEDEELAASIAAGCLADLASDLDAGACVLKLFGEATVPLPSAERFAHIQATYGVTGELSIPAGFLPREFTITDACVTNAQGIWFGKHFYL